MNTQTPQTTQRGESTHLGSRYPNTHWPKSTWSFLFCSKFSLHRSKKTQLTSTKLRAIQTASFRKTTIAPQHASPTHEKNKRSKKTNNSPAQKPKTSNKLTVIVPPKRNYNSPTRKHQPWKKLSSKRKELQLYDSFFEKTFITEIKQTINRMNVVCLIYGMDDRNKTKKYPFEGRFFGFCSDNFIENLIISHRSLFLEI